MNEDQELRKATKVAYRELAKEEHRQHRKGICLIIKMLLKGANPFEDNDDSLSKSAIVFYAFKAIYCFFVGRHRPRGRAKDVDEIIGPTIEYGKTYYGYDWVYLVVGAGVFKNWFCSRVWDSG